MPAELALPAKPSPLVLLKPGHQEPPVYVVHGIGGSAIELAGLGERLACGHPVYAIEPPGLDGAEPPLDDVGMLARHYLAAIKRQQPRGPILLIGFSFGGLVAIEIARFLIEAGEPPALLACLDSFMDPRRWPAAVRIGVRAGRALARCKALARMSPREALRYATMRAKARQRTDGPAGTAAVRGWLGSGATADPAEQRVQAALFVALARYEPRRYPGPIAFFKPRESANYPKDPRRVWRKLADRLDVRIVAGDHRSMVGADSAELASELDMCIRRAVRSVRPGTLSGLPAPSA